MTDRDIALVRSALEAAAKEATRRAEAYLVRASVADDIRALDPAPIVAGVPEFGIAAGFRHVPEDVHRLIVAERDALRTRVEELEKQLLDTTWQDHADHWQKQALKAEARVAELESAIRDMRTAAMVEDWDSFDAAIAHAMRDGK